jgi:hypothetical protein
MARTISANVIAHYASENNLSSVNARKALNAMDDADYQAVIDDMPSAAPVGTTLHKPEEFKAIAKIIAVTELRGDNEGSSIVECVTSARKPIAFVVTNKQAGSEERRGFGLREGSIFEFTLEERIEGVTQYLNKDTGSIDTHQKSGNGFVKSGRIDEFAFMIEQATSSKPEHFQAILNAGVALQAARMQYAK